MEVRVLLCGGLVALLCACQKPNSLSGVYKANSACSNTAIPNNFVVKWKTGEISVENYSSFAAMEDDLGIVSDEIEMMEDDHVVGIKSTSLGESNTTASDNWGQTMVQVADAYSQNIYGEGVKVAIVDTGVDITHPQLAGQMAVNAGESGTYTDRQGVSHNRATNSIDDEGNGYIDDVYGYDFNAHTGAVGDGNGHGTHVSGIVAADPTLGSVQGLAPKAKLIDASFMAADGTGTMGNASLAIEYAVSRGAKIVSASWGGDGCSAVLQKTISSLEGRGVLFVVAAGNGDEFGRPYDLDVTPQYPAAYPNEGQITVGASGTNDRMASFSNYSTTLVHLLAPGVAVVSTWPGNTTKSEDGTSMATPFISGAAALLMSAFPNASVLQVKQALLSSVNVGNFPVVSSGRLNIPKAIAAMRLLNP